MKRIVCGVLISALAFACGGQLTPDEDTNPWGSTTTPSYAPLATNQQTPAICNQGALVGGSDDSCLATPITCAGALQYECFDYSTPDALIGGSISVNASSTETDGVGHYNAPTSSDQISSVLPGHGPTQFRYGIRMKVSAATGSVTLLSGDIDTEANNGETQSMTVELIGSNLQLCIPGANATAKRVCTPVGTFGRDVWHTMMFSYINGIVSLQLDCQTPTTTTYQLRGVPEPLGEDGVSLSYGIMFPTCASDVFIDIVRNYND